MQIKHQMKKVERDRLNEVHRLLRSPGEVDIERLKRFQVVPKGPRWRGEKNSSIDVLLNDRKLFTITPEFIGKDAIIQTAEGIGEKSASYIGLIIDEMVRAVNERAKMERAFQREKEREEEIAKENDPEDAVNQETVMVTYEGPERTPEEMTALSRLKGELFPNVELQNWAGTEVKIKNEDGSVRKYFRESARTNVIKVTKIPENELPEFTALMDKMHSECLAEMQRRIIPTIIKEKIEAFEPSKISRDAFFNKVLLKNEGVEVNLDLGDGIVIRKGRNNHVDIVMNDLLLMMIRYGIDGAGVYEDDVMKRFGKEDPAFVANNTDKIIDQVFIMLTNHLGVDLKEIEQLDEDKVIEELEKIDFSFY